LPEYRGYGISRDSGTPSEEGLYRDAEAILDSLRERGFGPERNLDEVVPFAMGRPIASTVPNATLHTMTLERRGAPREQLAHTDPFLHPVSETLVEADDGGIGRQDLQVHFLAAKGYQRGFEALHERPSYPPPLPLRMHGDGI
jgi:hypothetical protein